MQYMPSSAYAGLHLNSSLYYETKLLFDQEIDPLQRKTKELEDLLGRKLSLKEKLTLKLYKWKQKISKSGAEKIHTKNGKTAFILGICALGGLVIGIFAIFSIPAAILAIIYGNKALKENPDDTEGKTGMILGWVTLGLILLAIVAVLALISAFSIH